MIAVNNSCCPSNSRSLMSSSFFSWTMPNHTQRVKQSTFLPVTLPSVHRFQKLCNRLSS